MCSFQNIEFNGGIVGIGIGSTENYQDTWNVGKNRMITIINDHNGKTNEWN